MPLEPLLDPLLTRLFRHVAVRVLHRVAQHGLERDAGFQQMCGARVQLPEMAVGHHQPALGVPQRKALVERLQGVFQALQSESIGVLLAVLAQ